MRWFFALALCLAPVMAQDIDETARQLERTARLIHRRIICSSSAAICCSTSGFAPGFTVFDYGVGRYPKSARLRVGLGVALYSLGRYDEAVERLCQAVDLDPRDTKALDFLGKMHDVSPQYANRVADVSRALSSYIPEMRPPTTTTA